MTLVREKELQQSDTRMNPVIPEGMYFAHPDRGGLSSCRINESSYTAAQRSGVLDSVTLDGSYRKLIAIHQEDPNVPFPDGLRTDIGWSGELHMFHHQKQGEDSPIAFMHFFRRAADAKHSLPILRHDRGSDCILKTPIEEIFPGSNTYIMGLMGIWEGAITREVLPPTYKHVLGGLKNWIERLSYVDPVSKVVMWPMGPKWRDENGENFGNIFCRDPSLTRVAARRLPPLGFVARTAMISERAASEIGMKIMRDTYFGSGFGPVYSGSPREMLSRMRERRMHGGRS